MNVDLSVNKLVVYQSATKEFKGFLIKTDGLYSIKVIESTKGKIKVDSTYKLNSNELDYLNQSEYPKLMAVSMRSWHYHLVKYVLGSGAPTPETMRNGCPYFWLFIFSLFVCTFVFIGSMIKKVAMLFDSGIQKFFDVLIDHWLLNVGESEMYDYAQNDGDYYKPNYFTKAISGNKYNVFDKFVLLKYGIDKNTDSALYMQKNNELFEKWKAWRKEENEYAEKNRAEYQKNLAKKKIKDAKWEARMKPINNAFANASNSMSNFFNKIHDAFTVNANIIKNTKKIVGFLVTVFLLATSFIVASIISYLLVMLFEGAANNIGTILMVLGYSGVFIALVLVLLFIYFVLDAFAKDCMKNKNTWYSKFLRSAIFSPIAIAGIFILRVIYYIIILPLKFVVYDFLWKIVCVAIIAGSAVGIFNLILNSGGIFSDYFKASYSDYCPGIEWIDTEDEVKNNKK